MQLTSLAGTGWHLEQLSQSFLGYPYSGTQSAILVERIESLDDGLLVDPIVVDMDTLF